MQGFTTVLMETIDEVVRNVFENEIAEIILNCLGKDCSKSLDERVQFFEDSLPKILGTDQGAQIIKDLILETLYSKLGSKFQWKEGYRLQDYVIELREKTVRSKV